jgi:hypothetical protein
MQINQIARELGRIAEGEEAFDDMLFGWVDLGELGILFDCSKHIGNRPLLPWLLDSPATRGTRTTRCGYEFAMMSLGGVRSTIRRALIRR